MAITESQRQQRIGGLGSSDSPVILGLSAYRTPADLLAEKTGRVPISDDAPSKAARLGTAMEPVIADLLEEAEGVRLVCPTATFEAPNGVMIANPDRFVWRCARGEPIAELKHTRIRDGWGHSGSDDVPDPVMVQVQHQMLCTGSPFCFVARLDAFSAELTVYRVTRNEGLIAIIESRCVEWWTRHVVNRDPLGPGAAPPSEDVLKRIQRVSAKCVSIPSGLIERLEAAKAEWTRAETDHAEAKAALLDTLGDAETGIAPDGRRVTYFACRDGVTLDAKRLQAEHPDLYAQYLKPRPGYRTLRIVNPQGAE